MCASSIVFDPEVVEINRDNPEMVPVLMTLVATENSGLCNYVLNMSDPDNNKLGQKVSINSIAEVSDSGLFIDFEKNDFLKTEMWKDGLYLLEIKDTKTGTVKGQLSFDLTSSAVLGASHERGQSDIGYILAAIIIMAGGVGVYVSKKASK